MQKQLDENNKQEPLQASKDVAAQSQDLLGEGEDSLENSSSGNVSSGIGQVGDKAHSSNVFLIVAVVGMLAVGALIYFWLNSHKKIQSTETLPFGQKAPATSGDIPAPALPGSSSPDTSIAITPPPPPAPPPVVAPTAPPPLAMPKTEQNGAAPAPPKIDLKQQESLVASRTDAKMKASIMLTNASAAPATSPQTLTSATASGDFVPDMSSASTIKVSTVGDMSLTIAQGKILDGVLETPVNTRYPGPVRALISRDVFSDRGNNVLIPKGSRLIGSLNGGYTPGSNRVMISWVRIIMPSGHDLNVGGFPAVGPSGTIGLEGIVDRQLLETLGGAALLSIINIGTAKLIQDEFKVGASTSSSVVGTNSTRTQSTQTPAQQAAQNEVQNLSDMTSGWLKQNSNSVPYIVLDQGTRVKVFVNQDIRFPKNMNNVQSLK